LDSRRHSLSLMAGPGTPAEQVDVCHITETLLGALSIDVDTVLSLQSEVVAMAGLVVIAIATGAALLFGPALLGDGSILKLMNLLVFFSALVCGAWGCKIVGLPGSIASALDVAPWVDCSATLFLLVAAALTVAGFASNAVTLAFFVVGAAAGGLVAWNCVGAAAPFLEDVPLQKYDKLIAAAGALVGGCVLNAGKEKLISLAAAIAGALIMAYGLATGLMASGDAAELVVKLKFVEYYAYYYAAIALLLLAVRFSCCKEAPPKAKPTVMQ